MADITQKTFPAGGREIAKRIALPFLLFSFVLSALLIISYYLLLPEFTKVKVNGKNRDTAELRAYVLDLREKVGDLEWRRSQFVTPLREGLYGKAKAEKPGTASFLDLRDSILETAVRSSDGRKDAVKISSLSISEGSSLRLEGRVMNSGPGSMTVLARFVDMLGEIEGIQSVEPPDFERLEDGKNGFYSPFDFILKLK